MEQSPNRDYEPSVDVLERVFPESQLNDGVMDHPVISHVGSPGRCNCEQRLDTIVVE